MYIASARAQFKINTHGCWNWHICIPDGLLVVQCSLGHAIGIVCLTQFQWHEANVLDNWQLALLPQSGGREFDPRRVHGNLSVPVWAYMRFPVSEHRASKLNQYIYIYYIYILQPRCSLHRIPSNHRCSMLTTVQHNHSMEHQCHRSQHSRFNRPSMASHQKAMRSPQHTPRNKVVTVETLFLLLSLWAWVNYTSLMDSPNKGPVIRSFSGIPPAQLADNLIKESLLAHWCLDRHFKDHNFKFIFLEENVALWFKFH